MTAFYSVRGVAIIQVSRNPIHDGDQEENSPVASPSPPPEKEEVPRGRPEAPKAKIPPPIEIVKEPEFDRKSSIVPASSKWNFIFFCLFFVLQ